MDGLKYGPRSTQVSALAHSQLEAWENLAKKWPLIPVERNTEDHAFFHLQLACLNCGMTVWTLSQNGGYVLYTHADVLSATVAHLRNVHRELDPDA